jgi:type III secretion protein U
VSERETSEEKTLPPSAKKLEKAREEGRIAHSKEAVTAAVTATAFGYLLIFVPSLFSRLSDGLLAVPDLYARPLDVAVSILLGRLGSDIALATVPLIVLLISVAIITNIAINGGVVIAFDPVAPKMERLDPVAGLLRMFGLKTCVELIKSIVKLASVGIVAFVIIAGAPQALADIPACALRCAVPIFGTLLSRLLLTAVALFLLLGGLDIGLQRWLFRREMRMTKTEQKRERKDSEGDPMIRRQRLKDQRGSSRSKTGLRNATFLIRSADIVLAMRYAAPDATVPILVARGTHEGAFRLLDEAKALNLPVVFNAAAVALLAPRLKVGRIITADVFQPIIGCMREAGIL